jgi:hypothetical protein
MELTQSQIEHAVLEAKEAAFEAADRFFKDKLGGRDQFACGFAWVDIYSHNGQKIKGNTKIGKMLKAAGVRQSYTKAFQIWNPAGYGCQNVDTLEEGACAAADVFRKYGFEAYAGSRLD